MATGQKTVYLFSHNCRGLLIICANLHKKYQFQNDCTKNLAIPTGISDQFLGLKGCWFRVTGAESTGWRYLFILERMDCLQQTNGISNALGSFVFLIHPFPMVPSPRPLSHGARAILRTHHRKNNLGFFACINKLSRHYSCPLLTVHQLRYARIAIGVRPYRNWSTTVSQLEYGGQMALTAPKKRSFASQKGQEITRVPSLAIPVRQW